MIFIKTLIAFFRDPEYRDLILTSLFILIMGMFAYHYLEGWSYVDSFYFSLITLTTVGYGDFSPQTTAGKLFTIFYIIVGIGLILSFMNTFFMYFQKHREKEKEIKV